MENNDFNLNNVLELVDELSNNYHLPEVNITNGEWQSLLDNLSNCFSERKNNDFKNAINIIIRRAINEALIDNCDQITFYYVIFALKDLVAFSIYDKQIVELKNKIMLDALKNNTKKEISKIK